MLSPNYKVIGRHMKGLSLIENFHYDREWVKKSFDLLEEKKKFKKFNNFTKS